MGKWTPEEYAARKRVRPEASGKFTEKQMGDKYQGPYGTTILTDGSLDYSYKGEIRLNRSRKWPTATTYTEAAKQDRKTLDSNRSVNS